MERIKKLKLENAELAYKLSKLRETIKKYDKKEIEISEVQSNMLRTQLFYMDGYKKVLSDRIKDLEK